MNSSTGPFLTCIQPHHTRIGPTRIKVECISLPPCFVPVHLLSIFSYLIFFLLRSLHSIMYLFPSTSSVLHSLASPPPNPYNPFPTPICQRAIKAGHPSELSFILLRRVEVTTTQTTWVFSAPYSLTPHHFCLPVP